MGLDTCVEWPYILELKCDDKKTLDDFEFNQDNSIEFDEEYRSPGWDRYRKNKILKWKK